MNVTIVAANGEKVTASAEKWLCALIALTPPEDRERLLRLVATRMEFDVQPSGHIIGVPGIVSDERVNG